MSATSKPTKLTLRLDSTLIKQAKRYADQRGTSISQMVTDYFRALTRQELIPANPREPWKNDLPPITRSLVGSLAGSSLKEEDYLRYLDEKHR
jgi:antitoxin component of RelBE/YafQ-DinJ toxin-antitoxin module